MSSNSNRELPPQKRDELLSRPEVKQRLLAMNVLIATFFGATIAYFVILNMGLLGEPVENSAEGFQLWYILIFLSVSTIPLMLALGTVLLRGIRSATTWGAVLEKGQQLLIIELALGEAVSVYGLIGGFLGAPRNVQYGLMVFGIILMAVAVLTLRGRILDLVLIRLAEEESNRNR